MSERELSPAEVLVEQAAHDSAWLSEVVNDATAHIHLAPLRGQYDPKDPGLRALRDLDRLASELMAAARRYANAAHDHDERLRRQRLERVA